MIDESNKARYISTMQEGRRSPHNSRSPKNIFVAQQMLMNDHSNDATLEISQKKNVGKRLS